MVALPPAHGMAANDLDEHERPLRGSIEYLSAPALRERLEEEVNRAGRHGVALSCLLIAIEDLSEVRRAHGEDLAEEAIAYVELALRRELRRFDRVGSPADGELLVVLPGADGPRGEVVARRLLARLRSIKFQEHGQRRSLRIALGLADWREGMSAAVLLSEARAAAYPERSGAYGPEGPLGQQFAAELA
jgi:PleD family two-component response regulator